MNKDKVIIELLMAILKGINLLVIKQSTSSILNHEDNTYTKYAKSTNKLAEEYLERRALQWD